MQEEAEPLSLPPEVDEADTDKPSTRRERLRVEAKNILSGLEAIRPRSRTVSAAFLIYERDRQFPTTLLIGAVASRLVIFLIPYLILIIFSIGAGADLTQTDASSIARDASLPQLFAQAASDSSAASTGLQGLALVATLFAVYLAASGLGKAVQLAYAVVWRVPNRPTRRWFLPLVVIGVVLLMTAINGIGSRFEEPGPGDDILRLLVELLLISGIWLAVSRALPHAEDAGWRDFVPGTLLMAIGVIGIRAAMIFYLIPKWETLDERYGDVGIVLVMLSWSYIVGAATVLSAHVNAALFDTRSEEGGRPRVLPGFIREQWRQLRHTQDREA
jgi:membrane protein